MISKDQYRRRSSLSSISDILEPDQKRGKSFGRETSKPKRKGDKDQDKSTGRKDDIIPLTDLECVLAVPRVKGFDLIVKEWCMISKAPE
jgi:hypothetical protein